MLFISEMKSLSLIVQWYHGYWYRLYIINVLDIHAWTFASIWAYNSGYDGI